MTKQRASKLTLICDPGTSLTKVLYRLGRKGSVKHLTMDSHLLTVGADIVERLNKTSEFGRPEDNAWLQTDDSSCHLVGRLAQEYRSLTSIKSLKYESIVPKVLALIGAIIVKEKLSHSIKLDLAVLLPYGEFGNSSELEKELLESISQFKFQGDDYKVELQQPFFFPEGSGIFFHASQNKSEDLIQSETSAVLMFGYRNTSLLLFKNGTLSLDNSGSTDLGFYNFSDSIIKQTSGLTRENIQSSVYTCQERVINPKTALGEDKSVTKIAVEDLVKARDPQRAKAEKSRIETAISNSRKEYWQLITAWLDETLPSQRHLDNLIYTGGTSGFFQQELQNYMSKKYSHIKVSSTEEIGQELLLALNLSDSEVKKFEKQELPLRFADAWGLFINFVQYDVTPLNRVLVEA